MAQKGYHIHIVGCLSRSGTTRACPIEGDSKMTVRRYARIQPHPRQSAHAARRSTTVMPCSAQ